MFDALFNRKPPSEWQKIPWQDPDFSRRMLAEHLNQAHDAASRRTNTIEQHVQWIQRKWLYAGPATILDLGCGPGFYTSRLSALGHQCTGIDISPASIEYAVEQDLSTQYVLGDIRKVDYGDDYDLILLIYGELNAFSREDARSIIGKAYEALKQGGRLILEVSTYESIYRDGNHAASWYTADKGLFADEPYFCLTEARFDVDCSIEDYYVYLKGSGTMHHFTTMHQGYTEDEYRQLLTDYSLVQMFPSLTGSAEAGDMFVIVATK
jgi:SAM-dependent methyltransferase